MDLMKIAIEVLTFTAAVEGMLAMLTFPRKGKEVVLKVRPTATADNT